MADLTVRVGELSLRNPVMPASGCFAIEYREALDLTRLGALVIKSVSPVSRPGNPTPRVADAGNGMLNSIGIPSHGIDYYLEHVLPAYTGCGTPVVASVSADTAAEFARACEALSLPEVAAIEANISCPNLEADGMAFGMDAGATRQVVDAVRRRTRHPLWVKLTPNAGNVAKIAKAAEDAGADAVVMGNTVLGMSIDVRTRRPSLGNVMGGLSGPSIKPIALRLVHQCHRAISIPVIGCGGIQSADDAIEFLLAGASAVQVGTASFRDPGVMRTIVDGLERFCTDEGVDAIASLTGQIRLDAELGERWQRFCAMPAQAGGAVAGAR
ncbi:dihydroorotate dehydrogenase [Burkholderia oklahomensis]|uniref:dihydroorotate dehydrogenase n=1 Tax=Burkholderia oklahomensis TaxID=342113 RepID=UPI0004736E5E|nr:dihydroorotate dehydrogenase [Burkholderia oklahomensis]AJX35914.1 dihydroorotate dehydrogenase family domain protein [Burkholderia oklahomensis C6786]AOI49321.1 dihydroorotate dehydrogenase [Burkholderia oklahomensis C6786]KUY60632.1 dihydroorotate dehydrogenase [Burkholderia oklahomensis C6786]MBI0362427.1 dihydroorotate dehydrogenase [Burkholderia oklahomensis]SUY26536.1 Dihydroorotate dehydrogenase B (NAD(+)), catalytic subunit [Burkholderia oklahomensis]